MGTSFQANRKHKKAGHSKSTSNGKGFKDVVEKKSVRHKVQSKSDNLNTKRQLKENALKASTNKNGSELKPPKNISIISLSSNLDALDAKNYILTSTDIDKRMEISPLSTVGTIPKFNTRINLSAPPKNIISIYDSLKSADCCIFLIDAIEGADDDAPQFIDALKAHGYPSVVFGLVINLDSVPKKEQKTRLNDFAKFFNYQFIEATTLDARSLPLVIRAIALSSVAPIPWTAQYPHFKLNDVEDVAEGTLLKGWLRGRELDVNRIIHVSNVGDFVPSAFFEEVDPIALNSRNAERILLATPTNSDEYNTITPAKEVETVKQEETNVEEAKSKRTRRVTRFDDSEDDIDNGEIEFSDLEEQLRNTEFDMEIIEEKAVYEVSKRTEDELDLPDEVDLDDDITVREKYADYRALTSFRSSEWSPYENLPPQFSQIYEFDDFTSFTNWSRKASFSPTTDWCSCFTRNAEFHR